MSVEAKEGHDDGPLLGDPASLSDDVPVPEGPDVLVLLHHLEEGGWIGVVVGEFLDFPESFLPSF